MQHHQQKQSIKKIVSDLLHNSKDDYDFKKKINQTGNHFLQNYDDTQFKQNSTDQKTQIKKIMQHSESDIDFETQINEVRLIKMESEVDRISSKQQEQQKQNDQIQELTSTIINQQNRILHQQKTLKESFKNQKFQLDDEQQIS